MQRKLERFVVEAKEDYVNHPSIRLNSILLKEYQINIAKKCIEKNTAVILPTGLGKTIIAFLVMSEFLDKKTLFLAPTRPLVQQHYDSILKYLNIGKDEVVMFTGSISAKKRAELWNKKKIIISTPQTIDNDVKNEVYEMDADLIIFDEMHKAAGNYSYVNIAKNSKGRILALTASPGTSRKKVKELMETLKIENVEARTRYDEDVKNHVKDVDIKWVSTDLNEDMIAIKKLISEFYFEKIAKLNRLGLLRYKKPEHISKKDILFCRQQINKFYGRRKVFRYAAYLNQSLALQSYHCLELLETQGIAPLLKYLRKIEGEKNSDKILEDERIKKAIMQAHESKTEHPKLDKVGEIITKQLIKKDSMIILFTQYRSTIDIISEKLDNLKISYSRFVGQSSREDKGMPQKEQKQVVEDFKKHKFNVLIATSVAEEGIDIPDVDLVLFYEPIPSAIRSIQRRGRTGRSSVGKVIVLYAKDTRDEAFLYSEVQKEKKMNGIVKQLSRV